jgi:hypothetical protein
MLAVLLLAKAGNKGISIAMFDDLTWMIFSLRSFETPATRKGGRRGANAASSEFYVDYLIFYS